MRYLILLLPLTLFAVDETPRVESTRVDRVQGSVDAMTGKIESLQVWDVNEAVDAVGQRRQIGERATIITRATHPALFAALDAVIAGTSARDQKHKEERQRPAAAEPRERAR